MDNGIGKWKDITERVKQDRKQKRNTKKTRKSRTGENERHFQET